MANPFDSWSFGGGGGGSSFGWSFPHSSTVSPAIPGGGGGGNSSLWPDVLSNNPISETIGHAGDYAGYAITGKGQARDFLTHDLWAGLLSVGKIAAHDLIRKGGYRDPRESSWSYFFEHPVAWAQLWAKDPGTAGGGLIVPMGESYKNKYLSTDVLHNIKEDPLGTALDLSVAGKFAGARALSRVEKAAAAGKYEPGSTLYRISSQEPRAFKIKPVGYDGEGLNVPIYHRAASIQGRYLQDFIDQTRLKLPSSVPFSGAKFAGKVLSKERSVSWIRYQGAARKAQLAAAKLSPEERRAIPLIAELPRHTPDPIGDLIDLYTKELQDRDRARTEFDMAGEAYPQELADGTIDAQIQNAIKEISMIPKEKVYHPSEALKEAVDLHRQAKMRLDKLLVEKGWLAAERIANRRVLVTRLMGGARHVKGGTFKGTYERTAVRAEIASTKTAMDDLRTERTAARRRQRETQRQVEAAGGRSPKEMLDVHNARRARIGQPRQTMGQFVKGLPDGRMKSALERHAAAIDKEREATNAYEKARDAWHQAKAKKRFYTKTKVVEPHFEGMTAEEARALEGRALSAHAADNGGEPLPPPPPPSTPPPAGPAGTPVRPVAPTPAPAGVSTFRTAEPPVSLGDMNRHINELFRPLHEQGWTRMRAADPLQSKVVWRGKKIYLPQITSRDNYHIALHELGHIEVGRRELAASGMGTPRMLAEERLDTEAKAWLSAFRRAKTTPTVDEFAQLESYFRTYYKSLRGQHPGMEMTPGVHEFFRLRPIPEVKFRETTDYHDFSMSLMANHRDWNLTPHSEREMAASRVFVSEDGMSGYAISPEGDLQNVFNNGGVPGAGKAAVLDAIKNGARTLDAYDGFLPAYYAKMGFVETARMKFVDEFAPEGWNYTENGRPDVVFMSYQGGNPATIESRVGSFDYERTDHYTEDWDAAKLQAAQAASPVEPAGQAGAAESAASGTATGLPTERGGTDTGQPVGGNPPGGEGRLPAEVGGSEPAYGPLAQFGPTFRWAHHAANGETAGYTRHGLSLVRKELTGPVTKTDTGANFLRGAISLDYNHFTMDILRQYRDVAAAEAFDKWMVPLSGKLELDLIDTGGKLPTDKYIITEPGGKLPTELRRMAESEAQRYSHAEDDNMFNRQWRDVAMDDHDLPPELTIHPGETSEAWLSRLDAAGVRRVPADVVREWEREFGGTNFFFRKILRGGLNQVWRYFLLGIKPAWSVNNALTNEALVMLKYAGVGGGRAFIELLRSERGDKAVRELGRYSMKMPGLGPNERRAVIELFFPELTAGSFGKELNRQLERSGSLKPIVDSAQTIRAARRVARWAGPKAKAIVRAPVQLNEGFNQWAENFSRDQAVLAELHKFTGTWAKSAEELQHQLESLSEEDGHRIVQNVEAILGDYSNLSRREREYVVSFAPFYPWFKTILGITARYVVRHPERLWVLHAISGAFQEQMSKDYQLGVPLPDFAAGLLPLTAQEPGPGGPQQLAWNIKPWNPFQTPVDIATVVATVARGDLSNITPSETGLSLLGPLPQAAYVAASGTDPFFGGDYVGPGQKQGPIFAGVGSLLEMPQMRLYQQLTGQDKSKLYNPNRAVAISQYLGLNLREANLRNLKARALEEQGRGTGGFAPPAGSGNPFDNWGFG